MHRALKFLLLLVAFLTMATNAFCDAADDYVNSGNVKLNKGDLDGAIVYYTKAIELKPNYALAYNNRGNAKRDKGDLDGAIMDDTKAIELNPDYAHAYLNRGNAKKAKGDLAGAMADDSKAIELDSKLDLAYVARGLLHYDSHAFKDGLVDFRKVVELDSTNDYARFRIWLIRARLGEAEAASLELQTYLAGPNRGKPNDWSSKIGHFLTGQMTEQEFLAAAKKSDQQWEAMQLCEAYFFAGSKHLFAADKATALDYFQKSIATNVRTDPEYTSAVAELKFLKEQKN